MIPFMIARLSRIVPLLVFLGVVAAVIYLVVAATRSPERAKEVLIKVFTVLNSAITVFFAIVSLYAWFEGNENVFDLAFWFGVTGLVCLGITYFARWRFLKNHPHYRMKPMRATIKDHFPWRNPRN